tara:strand:- start:196 stop:723 length:528 start_codon:yes stop_codon:yes gene_type:complete
MSTLFVDTINEKTSGNGVQIPGHVVQVVSAEKTDTQQISGSYADVLSATITPTSTTSKILVQVTVNGSATERYSGIKLFRGSTQIALGDSTGSVSRVFMSIDSNQDENTQAYIMRTMAGSFLDAPSTSSSVTYKIQAGNDHSGSIVTHINKMPNNDTANFSLRGITSITLMEIAQ